MRKDSNLQRITTLLAALTLATGASLTLASCSGIESPAPTSTPTQTTTTAASDDLAANLQYLIEEEKLANSVYEVMYELWGSRVFGNIVRSEESHQSQVLAVLQTYGVEDPRLSDPAKFTNPELQELYDSLIAQGSESEAAAFDVGVAIEELDIEDLDKMLEQESRSDVIAMMQNLRAGSVNHLNAFQRQQ